MWFFENEKRARTSEAHQDPSADDIIPAEHTDAPIQSSLENLLDRRIEHHSYRFAKTNVYPY